MKKYTIIIFLYIVSLVSSLQLAFAQEITLGEHTINNSTYKVTLSYDQLRIHIVPKNKPSIPDNKEIIDGLISSEVYSKPTNLKEWQQLAINTLPKEKVDNLKQRKEKLSIIFVVKPSGEIYYMSYTLPHNTILTLQDLSNIDKKIMDNYKIKMQSPKNRHLQLSYIIKHSELDFEKL